MATITDRLIELLTEQHNAINTVENCRRQIAALLAEQWHREKLDRGTVSATGEREAEPPPKRRQPSTQPDDTSDEDLLEALRIHETPQPTVGRPTELGATSVQQE